MIAKVAVAQFESTDDRERNLDTVAKLIAVAASEGVQILAFHELCTTPYFCFTRDRDRFATAETVPGPSTDRVAELATLHDVHVIFPIYERSGDVRYNTAAFVEPGRGVVGSYQKSHVPTARARGAEPGADEAFYFKAGDTGFTVWNTALGIRVGVQICYDRHFPEGARSLGLQGADVVFVPTASYRKFIIETLWEAELQAMAFQNTFYVAGINKIGPVTGFEDGRRFPGRSIIVDYEGHIVAQAGDGEGIITFDIDTDKARSAREVLRFYEYRRPDLYGAVVGPVAAPARL